MFGMRLITVLISVTWILCLGCHSADKDLKRPLDRSAVEKNQSGDTILDGNIFTVRFSDKWICERRGDGNIVRLISPGDRKMATMIGFQIVKVDVPREKPEDVIQLLEKRVYEKGNSVSEITSTKINTPLKTGRVLHYKAKSSNGQISDFRFTTVDNATHILCILIVEPTSQFNSEVNAILATLRLKRTRGTDVPRIGG